MTVRNGLDGMLSNSDRSRLVYRVRQFWNGIFAEPTEYGLKRARELLNPKQLELFTSMSPADQAHALRVLWTLQARGENHPDLLVAALLHDVGKTRHPLRLWERALAVLAEALFPEKAKQWSQGEPRGWRRAFVIARQHPDWGAELAAMSGASPLAVNLIWRHQERPSALPDSLEDRLLRALRAADEDN